MKWNVHFRFATLHDYYVDADLNGNTYFISTGIIKFQWKLIWRYTKI